MVTWNVWAGSAAGTAHLRHGRDCDDAYATGDCSGALLLAVADGASGARFGALGARLAVALGVREARAALLDRPECDPSVYWKGFVRDLSERMPRLFARAAASVLQTLGEQSINGLATTLCLAVIDHPWIAVCSFGDAFVVIRSGEDHFDILSVDRSQPAADSPVFVSDPQAAPKAVCTVAKVGDLTGVAVSTDGLDTLALEFERGNPARPFTGFFLPLFQQAQERTRDDSKLIRLLASERLCGQTEDDKTLLLAVRTS